MNTAKTNNKPNIISAIGYLIFGLSMLAATTVLLVDPVGLDIRKIIVPLIVVLLLGSLAFSYPLAAKSTRKSVAIIGTVAFSVMFTMIALFIVAGVAWLVAVLNS